MSVERVMIALLLAGCGPLADTKYYGEPIFEIEGTVQGGVDLDFDGDVGVALLWSNADSLDDSAQAVLVETRFPARYTLKVFQPPPADSEVQVVGGQVLEASVGQILLFEDLDSDGVWEPEEQENLIGGAYNAAVLFVPEEQVPLEAPAVPDPNGDPNADPIESEFIPPLWVPDAGFSLIEVAPGPFCQVDWETWMLPADETAATLYVGYYDLGSDWDCDGSGDFQEVAGPDPGFDELCPPPDVMEEECMVLQEALTEQDALDFVDPDTAAYLESWLPHLLECYAHVCPELLEQAEQLLNP